MVTWSIRNVNGCVRKGQMTAEQIQEELLCFKKKAVKKMQETGEDHVLYGTKIYDCNDRLVTIQFCTRPMSDEEFYRLTRNAKNVMIYALHNHCLR